MGKKQVAVSLRKPPPADPDAFVAGGGGAQSSTSVEQRAAEGPNVVTRVGERRELTVYLPVALARQLSVRCVELDRDVSTLVAESLVKTLAVEDTAPSAAAALPPAPPSVFDRWARARALVSQFRARLPLGLA